MANCESEGNRMSSNGLWVGSCRAPDPSRRCRRDPKIDPHTHLQGQKSHESHSEETQKIFQICGISVDFRRDFVVEIGTSNDLHTHLYLAFGQLWSCTWVTKSGENPHKTATWGYPRDEWPDRIVSDHHLT